MNCLHDRATHVMSCFPTLEYSKLGGTIVRHPVLRSTLFWSSPNFAKKSSVSFRPKKEQ